MMPIVKRLSHFGSTMHVLLGKGALAAQAALPAPAVGKYTGTNSCSAVAMTALFFSEALQLRRLAARRRAFRGRGFP